MSARGWCYLLEEHGLGKGDFDRAQALIAEGRKRGRLPIDIVAEDGARAFEHEEAGWHHDEQTVDQVVAEEIERVESARQDAILLAGVDYQPTAFWDSQPFYIEMLVEKIDLRTLFASICEEFNIAIANARGWSDISMRYKLALRFQEMEQRGKVPVLLYAGDHDPVGLNISDKLASNLGDLSETTGWSPDELIVDRFGMNADFIEKNDLSWIDGLETGSGEDLGNPKHRHHNHDYVQAYIKCFGKRKVEANALVVRPDAGRQLCREAILKYIDAEAAETHWQQVRDARYRVNALVRQHFE